MNALEAPPPTSFSKPLRHLAVGTAVALLLHLLFFWALPFLAQWLGQFQTSLVQTKPTPVDITQVSPKQLSQIREQWRKLLIAKDPSPTTRTEPPPESRYDSDRNRRVEREQRAREDRTAITPQKGQPAASPQSTARTRPTPTLRDLGVKYTLRPTKKAVASESSRPAAAGREQSVVDDTLPVGSENLLNTRESLYYSFYSRVYQAIAPVWESLVKQIPRQRQLVPMDYLTVAAVSLDRQGNVVDIDVLESSGVGDFDQAVIQSWRRIGRFPNPPQGLLNAEGVTIVKWQYVFRLTRGMQLEYAPPQRLDEL